MQSVSVFRITLLVAAVCALLCDGSRTFIAMSGVTLLSGSTLTACSGATVNSSSCTGGFASLSFIQRNFLAQVGAPLYLIPTLDRSTAFVQMHPLTWAVNVPIMRYFNFDTYYAPPSFPTSEFRQGWEYFHNSSRPKLLLSNILVSATDIWSGDSIRDIVLGDVGFVIVDSFNTASNCLDPSATVEAILTSYRMKGNVNATVVVYTSLLETALQVHQQFRQKPDVLVKFEAADAPAYYINTTLVLSVALTASALHIFNISSNANGFINATVVAQTATVPIGKGDSQYYNDQKVMTTYGSVAATNDPVVGNTTGVMPVHRVSNIRLCLGGECPAGRLYAEAMRFTQDTDIAFTTSGAFRGNGFPAGSFRISDVWALNPFANAVCYGVVRGLTIWNVFNFSIALSTAPSVYLTSLGDRLLQTAGLRIVFNASLNNTRILSIDVRNKTTGVYEPLDRLKLYTYAADTYVSTTFAPFPSFLSGVYEGEAAPKCLTGTFMQTSVVKYMASLKVFNTSSQGSLVVVSSNDSQLPLSSAMNWAETKASCGVGEWWAPNLSSCIVCPAGYISTPASDHCELIVESVTWKIIAIAVPIGAVFTLTILAKMIHSEVQRLNSVRNIDNAPKSGEVTLLFTDIQDSTKLWGTCPASMAVALDHHHRIIRGCIARFRGYEVKTVGDCFMIAIGNAVDGVSLAVDIQHKLQQQRFPSAIAATYMAETEADLDAVVDDPEDLLDLDPIFNGLRVRIGMHTGTPDSVFDQVAKGFDYYGPPVNVAARVEATARGGEINATREVIERMGDRADVETSPLGPTQLKGVSGMTEIFHIVPVELKARSIVYADIKKKEGADADLRELASVIFNPANATGDAEVVRFISVFHSALRLVRPKEQDEIIETLCRAWRVKMPPSYVPLEEKIQAFAQRASKGSLRREMNYTSSSLTSPRHSPQSASLGMGNMIDGSLRGLHRGHHHHGDQASPPIDLGGGGDDPAMVHSRTPSEHTR